MRKLIKELRELAASEEVADRAADELERLQRENEEVMRQKAYQYQRAKKAEEELAALKASTEQPVAWLPSAEWTACVKLPVVVHVRSQREGE